MKGFLDTLFFLHSARHSRTCGNRKAIFIEINQPLALRLPVKLAMTFNKKD